MDRNTITGLVLIAAILLTYSVYNANKMKNEAPATEQSATDSLRTPTQENTYIGDPDSPEKMDEELGKTVKSDSLKLMERNTAYGPFSAIADGKEEFLVLENEDVKLTLSNKGGRVHKVELKNYMTYDSLPLILFEGDEKKSNYQFYVANNRPINTSELYFEIADANPADGNISFRLNAGNGKYFEQRYSLQEQGYLVDYQLALVGLNTVLPRNANYLNFSLQQRIKKLEKDKTSENRYTELHYKFSNGDIDELSNTSDDDESLNSDVEWISFKQQFFNTSLINKTGFENGTIVSKNLEDDEDYLKLYQANLALPYGHQSNETYNYQYYFGPNHFQTLKDFDIGLENIISLGWFGFINRWIIIPIFNLLEGVIGNYGIIILLLTLLIKILLSPLTYRSYVSQAKMKLLKPEIDELKEKYGEDQQKFGTEQMKLWQKAGVSPLGGCLPMVLQMPILLSMYYFFPSSVELRQESFLWAEDLSTYDSILNLPFEIPFYGDHVSLFTLLMTVTSILYASSNAQMTGGSNPQMAGMKYMPYIFPIFLLPVFNSFPAALTYYYFLSNLITYLQQWVIKRFIIDEDALHKQIQQNKAKPTKKSGWMQRLEDIQKEQQRQMNQKNKKR